jgi:predicted anti-sigma-YlaC factor YlaD
VTVDAIAVFRIDGCRWTRKRLSAYLENDLGTAARWLASRHLSRCERCRAVLRSLAETVEQLRLLGDDDRSPTGHSQADVVIEKIRRLT